MQVHDGQMDDRTAALERELIEEYLRSRGQTRESVNALATSESTALLRAASEYASLRLAEMQARAHYVQEIHGS